MTERQVREQAALQAAQASALRCPRAVISHFAAAVALGMPTYGDLARPCLTVPAGTALRHLADAHLHRATLVTEQIIDLDEYKITAPARTIMDIAREFGTPAGVVAADHAMHEHLLGEPELRDAFEVCRTWPGRKAARITLLSADGAAESPLESLSRLRIAAARLPRPALQQEICDLDGDYLTRCDFLWKEWGVVGEADGQLKYGPDGRHAEAERTTQRRLEEAGLIVVRWGWADLRDFGGVARRLRIGLERGARPGSPLRRWGLLLT